MYICTHGSAGDSALTYLPRVDGNEDGAREGIDLVGFEAQRQATHDVGLVQIVQL